MDTACRGAGGTGTGAGTGAGAVAPGEGRGAVEPGGGMGAVEPGGGRGAGSAAGSGVSLVMSVRLLFSRVDSCSMVGGGAAGSLTRVFSGSISMVTAWR